MYSKLLVDFIYKFVHFFTNCNQCFGFPKSKVESNHVASVLHLILGNSFSKECFSEITIGLASAKFIFERRSHIA